MTTIAYGLTEHLWKNFQPNLEGAILSRGFRKIVEIGGGANPMFSVDFIASNNIDYTVLDISQAELDKAPDCYSKVCADICAPDFSLGGGYDFAFSKMLAEHVSDGASFHRNVRSLLRPGGVAVHVFPTLFAPPFLLNYLLPEKLAESVLGILQPGRERSGNHGKFPARYSWCRGPLQSQVKRLEELGYAVDSYDGFFGHGPYYKLLPPLLLVHLKFAGWLARNPVPALTSFSRVTLVRQ